jgi:hypothetical protein
MIGWVGFWLVTAFESQGMFAPYWQASTAPPAQRHSISLPWSGCMFSCFAIHAGSFGPVYLVSGLSIVPTALQ